MGNFFRSLNPISRLGIKEYSVLWPLLVVTIVSVCSEVYAYQIANNPDIVGVHAIFLYVALIIYFSFRDGIRGGLGASVGTIAYYAYIVLSRDSSPEQMEMQWRAIGLLAGVYFILAFVIGWLKQTIDHLIEREADEKRRLRAVIQQLPVGVLVTDREENLIQANKQVENLLGREIRYGSSVLKNNEIKALSNGKPLQHNQWPFVYSLKTGKSVVGREIEFHPEPGKRVFLRISSSAIKNREGKIIAAASIFNDITAAKEMEERKDDFVNMASHELKTPLTSMKLYIDLLLRRMEQFNDERATKTLRSIKYQTDRLQELVGDLLDVSRIQTGKLSLRKENFFLDALIEETISELSGATRQQEIVFRKKHAVEVFADRFRIYQVITNLLTNAIKYSPPGANIVVTIEKKQAKALVSVKDRGIGIAKDHQKKIFERLYQVSGPKEKTFPGLGMGLFISKEIVIRHRGKIWVESETGKGATFYFSLPINGVKKRGNK